jgi:large subunit ribosomal protein L6
MSRIGKKPVVLPDSVTPTLNGQHIEVKGPKGSLNWTVPEGVKVSVDGNTITLVRQSEEPSVRALHGTSRAQIQNLVTGVSDSFKKELRMVGVGYRAAVQGSTMVINAGYSNPVELPIPKGLALEVEKNVNITVSGIDKQSVGEFAAKIRSVRKPEPYLGKGIRYVDEHVRRKEGKTAK